MAKAKSDKETPKEATEKAPVAETKAKTKAQDSLGNEVLVLPVKAKQERMVFAKDFHLRTQGTRQIVDSGRVYDIQSSSFNPETKRYEHQLSELAVNDSQEAQDDLVSRGWSKLS